MAKKRKPTRRRKPDPGCPCCVAARDYLAGLQLDQYERRNAATLEEDITDLACEFMEFLTLRAGYPPDRAVAVASAAVAAATARMTVVVQMEAGRARA